MSGPLILSGSLWPNGDSTQSDALVAVEKRIASLEAKLGIGNMQFDFAEETAQVNTPLGTAYAYEDLGGPLVTVQVPDGAAVKIYWEVELVHTGYNGSPVYAEGADIWIHELVTDAHYVSVRYARTDDWRLAVPLPGVEAPDRTATLDNNDTPGVWPRGGELLLDDQWLPYDTPGDRDSGSTRIYKMKYGHNSINPLSTAFFRNRKLWVWVV